MARSSDTLPPEASAQSGSTGRSARRWPYAFVACAGLLGGSGVAVAAAGAHTGGGDVARTASDFLLLHAASVLGASAVALSVPRTSVLIVMSLGLLTVGAALFGGELALSGLSGWRPLPLAAPTGGLCLIAGWLTLVAGAVRLAVNTESADHHENA